MNYLHDEQHYIDRYDLYTIEECLDTVKMFQEVYQKSLVSETGNGSSVDVVR